MITLSIIGSGALARSLFSAVRQEESISCSGVYGRNPEDALFFEGFWKTDYQELLEADILLLALPDKALSAHFDLLEQYGGLLAHCSGATSLSNREHYPSAVFYPLNSFSKEKVTPLRDTPIFIEASTVEGLKQLEKLALALSNRVHKIDSAQRLALHLAAVISQNFSNHLFAQTQQWCTQNQIDFSWLRPMLSAKFHEVFELNASTIQSGPAIRGDQKTLNQHRELLRGHVPLLEVYDALTRSIQEFHEKKL
ncbi:MAG: Rossmann-like and DUF2520 domain-containing protein [Flavobacteriaceae bacterium]